MALNAAQLDTVIGYQLAVAWAGEGGEQPRLGWWKSDLVSEYGGEDLFRRLLPHTWRWAVLQAAREAARRRDAQARAQYHNPDELISLFSFGFEVDEQLDQRLQDLKRAGTAPKDALPVLQEVTDAPRATKSQITKFQWDRDAFDTWIATHGQPKYASEPVGRRLKGQIPTQLVELAGQLLAALHPPAESYPLPHYRREG